MEKLQCSVCGGTLVMRDDGEKAVCESCGMSFKKETVKKMVMELSGPVKVEGIHNSDYLADRAETFLQMGETGKAKTDFRQMANEYPADYRGWWGLTRFIDWEQYFYRSGAGEAVMPPECKRALDFAPEEKKAEIRSYFEEQVLTFKPGADEKLRQEARYQQTLNQLNARVCEIENQVSNLSKSIEDLTNQIEEEEKQFYKKKRNQVTEGNIIALVIGCIFTYFAWVVYDPIGSPVVTLLGVGLPLLSLICRIRREKSHGDRVKKLKLQLKKLQQEWQEALKAREEAYAARVAAMNAKTV